MSFRSSGSGISLGRLPICKRRMASVDSVTWAKCYAVLLIEAYLRSWSTMQLRYSIYNPTVQSNPINNSDSKIRLSIAAYHSFEPSSRVNPPLLLANGIINVFGPSKTKVKVMDEPAPKRQKVTTACDPCRTRKVSSKSNASFLRVLNLVIRSNVMVINQVGFSPAI